MSRRLLVGVTLRLQLEGTTDTTCDPSSLLDEVIAATVHAAHELRVPALVCGIEHDVRALLSFSASANISRAVNHPASKSDGAASLHMSRPVFYDRLAKAERVLGVDLDDPEIRVSLHVALIADEIADQAGWT